MGNCASATKALMSARLNEWFRKKLWNVDNDAQYVNWFADTEAKLSASFEAPFPRCFNTPFPARPAPVPFDEATISTTLIETAVAPVNAWADHVTKVARCIQRKLPNDCNEPLADLILVLAECNSRLTFQFQSSADAIVVCNKSGRWARSFHSWSTILSVWENLAFACLKTESHTLKMTQVTRPPWPPWTGFNPLDDDT